MSQKIQPTIELLSALIQAAILESRGKCIAVVGRNANLEGEQKYRARITVSMDSLKSEALFETEAIFNSEVEARVVLNKVYKKRNEIVTAGLEKLSEVIKLGKSA